MSSRWRTWLIALVSVCSCPSLSAQTPDSVLLLNLLGELELAGPYRFNYENTTLQQVKLPRRGKSGSDISWGYVQTQLKELGIDYREAANHVIMLSRREDVEAPLRLQILDEQGEPLQGATFLSHSGKGLVTDHKGWLTLTAQLWQQGGEIRYLGCTPIIIPANSVLPKGERLVLERNTEMISPILVLGRLSPKPLSLVVSQQTAGAGGVRRELLLAPRALGDFGFSASAGASRIDSKSSAPALRGSLASETLVSLDGLPIYHLDHYFGFFPTVDKVVVSQLKLHRSHYPARWGGGTGGLLEIKSQLGEPSGLELELSQLAASGNARYSKAGLNLFFAGRTTLGTLADGQLLKPASLDLNTRQGEATGLTRPDFFFHDAYGAAEYTLPKTKLTVGANAFTSLDNFGYAFDQQQLLRPGQNSTTAITGRYNESSSWRNVCQSAYLQYALSGRQLSLRAYRSQYMQNLQALGTLSVRNRRGERLASVLKNSLDNKVVDQGLLLMLEEGSGTRSDTDVPKYQYGLQLQDLKSEAYFSLNDKSQLAQTSSTPRVHLFGEQTLSLPKNLAIQIGLRVSSRTDTTQWWLSPRIKIAKHLDRSSIHAGYSYTQQALRPLQHENQYGQTYTLLVVQAPQVNSVGTAHNYTLGLDVDRRFWNLRVEAYYRRLGGVLAALSQQVTLPRDAELVSLQPSFLSVEGQGSVEGIDVDFRYQKAALSGQAAYTLARSRRRFEDIAEGVWQRAPDDRRHRFASWQEWSRKAWMLGIAYEGATGLSYVDLNVLSSDAGGRGELNPEAYLLSLPAYHRLDVRSSWKKELKRVELTMGLRLYNVFDRDNVTQRQYVVGLGGAGEQRAIAVGTDVSLLGRLLIAELGLKF